MIALKQSQKTRLCAGRAFRAAERKFVAATFEFVQIEHEIVAPQRRAFADGRQLRGLEVRVTERRLVLPRFRKSRERIDEVRQRHADRVERFAHQDQVRIIGHVARGCAEVDDLFRVRCDFAVSRNMCHHVVPFGLFVDRGSLQVDIVEVRFQFR